MTTKKIEQLAYELALLELTRPSALDAKARTAYKIMQELRVPPWYERKVVRRKK